MHVMCASLANVGAISARFSARLAYAGALTALMRLAESAARHRPGASAVGTIAQTYETVLGCIEEFARSITRVRRPGVPPLG